MAVNSITNLTTLYANFANNSLGRYRSAIERSRMGKYSPEDVWKDWNASSVEMLRLWTYPYELMFGDLSAPTCQIDVATTAAVPVIGVLSGNFTASGAVDCTRLNSKLTGLALSMKVALSHDGQGLVVTVDSLAGAIKGEVFEGRVHPKGDPSKTLANVLLTIAD